MGISPRRAAGPLPQPQDSSPLPAGRRVRREVPRSRARVGILVSGLAVMIAGGAAFLPNAVAGLTAPDLNTVADRTPVGGATIPPSTDAAPTRVVEHPDRDAPAGPATFQRLTELTVVAGIPEPCSIDVVITDDMSAADITRRAEQQWGFDLTGPQWQQDDYRPIVKLFAETLDSVDCTDYLDRVKAGNRGQLAISSEPTRSWAWGDYGLTRPTVLTLDFEKFRQGYADGDRGRLVRLIIHEMAHSLNADRFSEPAYWTAFNQVWSANGPVSDYGSTATETFADAIGYYVARCAADNPYDTQAKTAYYDYVKHHIFAGREFGGSAGVAQACTIKGR